MGGITEAKKAAAKHGIRLVSGVEISITWAGTSIHIVGLNVDENDPVLIENLRRNRSGRIERAQRMGERLAELGVAGAYEGALKYVTNPSLISRKHFARFWWKAVSVPISPMRSTVFLETEPLPISGTSGRR